MATRALTIEDWKRLNPETGRVIEQDGHFVETVREMLATTDPEKTSFLKQKAHFILGTIHYGPVSPQMLDDEILDAESLIRDPEAYYAAGAEELGNLLPLITLEIPIGRGKSTA